MYPPNKTEPSRATFGVAHRFAFVVSWLGLTASPHRGAARDLVWAHLFPATSPRGEVATGDDALRAYQALLNDGHSPHQIVIEGDSACGNLSLITDLRLRGVGLPKLAAYVCFSPVTDFTSTQLHAPMAGDLMTHPAWLALVACFSRPGWSAAGGRQSFG